MATPDELARRAMSRGFLAPEDLVDAPEAPGRDEPDPRFLERFEVLGTLGEGASAIVFRARDRKVGREVALKRIAVPAGHAARADHVRQRFRMELRALAALRHPGIPVLFDAAFAGDHLYLVMEYVEGRSLRDLLARAGLPLDARIDIVEEVARIVEVAHAQGLVHRDLKPENVIVDGAGRAHVVDFGAAKHFVKDEGLTESGALVGTVLYMSPEQARGDSRSADARSDVFALGALLYEALTGAAPCAAAESLVEALHAISTAAVAPPSSVAGTPVAFDAVVARALAKRPDERFASAGALADALRAARVAPPRAARGGLVRAVSGLGALGVALGVGLLIGRGARSPAAGPTPPPPPPSPALVASPHVELDRALDAWESAAPTLAGEALDLRPPEAVASQLAALPATPMNDLVRSRALALVGRRAEALAVLDRAVAAGPSCPGALPRARATLLWELLLPDRRGPRRGRSALCRARIRADLERARSAAEPDAPSAWLLELFGSEDAAHARGVDPARSGLPLPQAHKLKGDVLLALGESADAASSYAKALDARPRWAAALAARSLALVMTERVEARSLAQRALAIDPAGSDGAVALYASLLEPPVRSPPGRGDPDRANACRQFLGTFDRPERTDDPMIRILVGRALVELAFAAAEGGTAEVRLLARASKHLDAVAEHDPGRIDAACASAEARLAFVNRFPAPPGEERGILEKAAAGLEELIRSAAPDEPAPYAILAAVCERQGRTADAREQRKRARELAELSPARRR